jgi:hypothetical protein
VLFGIVFWSFCEIGGNVGNSRIWRSPGLGHEHGFQYRHADENSLSCGGVAGSYQLGKSLLKTGIGARADRERVEKNRESGENELLQKDENLCSQIRRGSF